MDPFGAKLMLNHAPDFRFSILAVATLLLAAASPASSQPKTPFDDFPGFWSGEGRLGFSDGKFEKVSCRTTYFLDPTVEQLKQNIRCASGSAKIEVKSEVTHAAGKLSGTWSELVYDKSGALTGEITARGLRVGIAGAGVKANMDIMLRGGKQIIEIQFFDSTLLGLSLLLEKKSADTAQGP